MDWKTMRGHYSAKRVLEIAASGNHATLLVGPLNAGKTTIIQSLETILPEKVIVPLPHALSDAIKQIRGGILFLNHLEQWDEVSLALLRETITQRPGAFLFLATAGYCPCGNAGDMANVCVCSQEVIEAHQRRLGSIVHACFALEIYVPSVNVPSSVRPDESSLVVRNRVEVARLVQYRRNGEARLNSTLSLAEVERGHPWDTQSRELLELAHKQLSLSPEQSLYLQQVTATITDLAEVSWTGARHMAEAINYRPRWHSAQAPETI